MKTVIDSKLLEKLQTFDDDIYLYSCYSHINALVKKDNKYGVVISLAGVENRIVKWADSWEQALDWLQKMFRTQPAQLDHEKAVRHLLIMKYFPDDPESVWKNT